MQMLYDSDTFVVVHVDVNAQRRDEAMRHNEEAAMKNMESFLGSTRSRRRVKPIETLPVPEERHAFEIVDKRTNKEVLLTGAWAAYFQKVLNSWQLDTPHQEHVESVLDEICLLAQLPLVIH